MYMYVVYAIVESKKKNFENLSYESFINIKISMSVIIIELIAIDFCCVKYS